MHATAPASPAPDWNGSWPVSKDTSGLISVIVPFFNAAAHLEPCLQALGRSERCPFEVILVDDGSTDASPQIARRFADLLVTLSSSRGPALARNRGAEAARGDILVFLDADVYCYPDTLSKIRHMFETRPEYDALIGSYDDDPVETDFFSRYKNLTHHFVHQNASPEASTFWTGCGAIRRHVFQQLHGFNEGYRRPSIEDIELGYRLRARGHRIALCRHITVKHAKRWTFAGLLRSDIRDRAIPWTVLQLAHGAIMNDLNVARSQRAAAGFIYLALLSAVLTFWNSSFLWGTAAALLPVFFWNRTLYRFYFRRGSGGEWRRQE